MNVLCLDQFSELGGAQLCLRDLIPFMRRAGLRPHAIIPPGRPLVDCMRRAEIPVEELPIGAYARGRKTPLDVLRFPVDTMRAAAAIRRAIDRYGIDLAYVNGPRALPAAVLTGIPIVFHAHNLVHQGYARSLWQWAFSRFDGSVIAASHFIADRLSKVVPQNVLQRRLIVIHNGVSGPPMRVRHFGSRHPRVGIVGRLCPQKGHIDFMRAAQLVAHTNPHVQFAIVGASSFSDAGFETALRKRPESARVQFLGWSDDIQNALESIDILAVPSLVDEACPRVVLEALAAGTPVVAYPSGGIPELIEHGRTGLLTSSPSVDSMAAAIRFLIERPSEMDRISTAGRAEWESRFTIERFAQDVCAVLSASKPDSSPYEPRKNPRMMPEASDGKSHARSAALNP